MELLHHLHHCRFAGRFPPTNHAVRALTCLLAGTGIVAGCGATRTLTDTATVTTTTTTTVVHQARAPRPPARTVTVTHTVTGSSSTAAATFAPLAGPYSGNGSENVGTITVNAGATLQWACHGCSVFSIDSDLSGSNVISVDSQASSGSTFVDAGTYTNVRVISDGNWAFRIVP